MKVMDRSHLWLLLAWLLVVVVVLSAACSSQSTHPSDRMCQAFIDKVVECIEVTPEQVKEGLSECLEDLDPYAQHWREDFVNAFVTCSITMECEIVEHGADNIFDYCSDSTLEEINAGLIDGQVLVTCRSTQACLELAQSEGFTETGVVADCLRRWAACNQLGNDWIPEDYCLSLIAVTEPNRQAAVECLKPEIKCAEAKACLKKLGAFN